MSTRLLKGKSRIVRSELIIEHGFDKKKVDRIIKALRETFEYARIGLDGQQDDEAIPEEDTDSEDIMGESMGSVETKIGVKSDIVQKSVVKDYSIPRKGNRTAIIRLEYPVTRDDLNQISTWLKLMENTITSEDSNE